MKGMNATEIADIIQAYVKNADQKALNRTFKRGVIVDTDGQKADVEVEGNDTPTQGILSIGSYRPTVGDRVLVVSIGESGANLLILGSIKTAGTEGKWLPLPLSNGWNRYSTGWGAAEYMKANGVVRLRGMIKGGGTTGTVATLPVGFRPKSDGQVFLVAGAGGASAKHMLNIRTSGILSIESVSNNTWMSLDQISYVAE